MVKLSYLMYAATGFMVSLILMYMETQFQWIAIGFTVAMLLLGLFMKEKRVIREEDREGVTEMNNLNTPKESVI